ncbi:hypothetical protein [Pedobacter africanus]|uniref:Uncharacterized protein n=1 Tax=Pedobacter africanus TaxID=151894 RepID=A0A1W2BR72_9SPHI|nr:hypothetical protein [Pedobacter africanus]SMC75497.1 hypothetical protein SAMN04488524_2578 [Pedobacter africanus]
MKMILEFNLPEESHEANQALNVGKLSLAIWNYDQKLRGLAKHSQDEAEANKAQWARDMLWEELGEDGIADLFEMR